MSVDLNPNPGSIAARLDALSRRLAKLEAAIEELGGTTEELVTLVRQQAERKPLTLRDVRRRLSSLRKELKRRFSPRLWGLAQYPPCVLRVPASYGITKPPRDPPRIVIVTPSLNPDAHLKEAIDSVFRQKYPNLDYIVQDGGSTDGSCDVLKTYGDKLVWYGEPDTGQANAINRGFEKIDGDIMAYLNGDDMLLPGTLNYVAHYFHNNPSVDVVYGHRICIDEEGREIGRWVLPEHDTSVIKWADYIPQETMFWRRRVWDAVGPIDEQFQYALDWDFILRAHEKGFKFVRLPRFLGCFRIHHDQKTTALIEIGNNESALLYERSLGRVPAHIEINRQMRGYLRRHVAHHIMFRLGQRFTAAAPVHQLWPDAHGRVSHGADAMRVVAVPGQNRSDLRT